MRARSGEPRRLKRFALSLAGHDDYGYDRSWGAPLDRAVSRVQRRKDRREWQRDQDQA